MNKVFDACMFYNELDMLETRMHILDDVVDRFVVCEAAETHSGQPKPYYLEENIDRFARYADKIIYVQVPDLTGNGRNSWERERYHRSQIMVGLASARAEDYIIVGDCDEIANPEAVSEVIAKGYDGAILELAMYYYDLNHRVQQGWGIGMMRRRLYLDPNDIRTGNGRMFPHVDDGGWHFSYMGGPEQIIAKVNAFMHHNDPVIRDLPRDPGYISDQIAASRDLYGRDLTIERVPLSNTLPRYILDNLDHYKALGWVL